LCILGPSGTNRPNVFYEPYNVDRGAIPPPGCENGQIVPPPGHLTLQPFYQSDRRSEIIAQPVPLSTGFQNSLQFANFNAPPLNAPPRQTPQLATAHLPGGHIPLMLANNGPFHNRPVQYYSTSPSPSTYVVSSTDRRVDSPMSHVGSNPGKGSKHNAFFVNENSNF